MSETLTAGGELLAARLTADGLGEAAGIVLADRRDLAGEVVAAVARNHGTDPARAHQVRAWADHRDTALAMSLRTECRDCIWMVLWGVASECPVCRKTGTP